MTVTVSNSYNIRKQNKKVINSSMTNISRPISPTCIQIKEPLLRRSSINHLPGDYNNQQIPENGETYRNSHPNQRRHLSSSDPTLNQIEKISRRTTSASVLQYIQPSPQEEPSRPIENNSKKSPRHRIMSCTSGVNDSNDTSFYVMQNRPP
jgi:hypothetical protein